MDMRSVTDEELNIVHTAIAKHIADNRIPIKFNAIRIKSPTTVYDGTTVYAMTRRWTQPGMAEMTDSVIAELKTDLESLIQSHPSEVSELVWFPLYCDRELIRYGKYTNIP